MKLISNAFDIGKEIKRDIDAFRGRLETASMDAIKQSVSGLKLSLRMMTVAAGLGQMLANTWRDSTRGGKRLVFPQRGKSAEPSGVIFSRAPEIISSFDKGAIIRAGGKGIYLALPTQDTPKGPRGKPYTPSQWPVQRYGELEFVPSHKGGFLVANLVRSYDKVSGAQKGVRKATKRRKNAGREVEQIIMFYLVPQAKIGKRFDVQQEASKWLANMRSIFDASMSKKN
jgi:hypothetical protein